MRRPQRASGALKVRRGPPSGPRWRARVARYGSAVQMLTSAPWVHPGLLLWLQEAMGWWTMAATRWGWPLQRMRQ